MICDGSDRGYLWMLDVVARHQFSIKGLPIPTNVASTSAMGIHMDLRDALAAYLDVGAQHIVGLLEQ